jgi:hypothetical protein
MGANVPSTRETGVPATKQGITQFALQVPLAQSLVPVGQLHWHALATHFRTNVGSQSGHTLLHAPQLLKLVLVLTHEPPHLV